MANKRITGIDFGTSTSVIRVKSYTDADKNKRNDTKPVTFNNGSTMVPTVIQKVKDAGTYFGYDAEVTKKKGTMFRNFKLDLQSFDKKATAEAKKLTKEYFEYLYKEYSAQSQGGHLGDIDEEEETVVSYPVKWTEKTREFMIKVAAEAGFKNVSGMDEAEAAIRAVTVQYEELLHRKGYLSVGTGANILLIDMGAGTTDIVLSRFTPGEEPKNEIITVWPKDGTMLFGGREVDELLKSYIAPKIPEMYRDSILERVGIDKFKAWKDEIVSPSLKAGRSVDEFSAADTFLQFLGAELDEFSLDRSGFEDIAKEYLKEFPKLINDCLKSGRMSGDDIDIVILTGGHSQWYFVEEILKGSLSLHGEIKLGKIQADPQRIISVALPQETVALGLAYSGLAVNITEGSTEGVYPPVEETNDDGGQTEQPDNDYPHGEETKDDGGQTGPINIGGSTYTGGGFVVTHGRSQKDLFDEIEKIRGYLRANYQNLIRISRYNLHIGYNGGTQESNFIVNFGGTISWKNIIFYRNLSLLRNGEEGMLMTDDMFYWKANVVQPARSIPLNEIDKFTCSFGVLGKQVLSVQNYRGELFTVAVISSSDAIGMETFLNDALARCRAI